MSASLPDLDHARTTVLNTLSSAERRGSRVNEPFGNDGDLDHMLLACIENEWTGGKARHGNADGRLLV
jgi:hypothetical protein